MSEAQRAADAAEAWSRAQAAANRHGLRIAELTEMAEYDAAAELFCRIWRVGSADELINTGLMRALAYAGNYVVGAYRGGALVGAAVAFRGADHLHSHITGVVPEAQGGGVGYALKQHQRAWSLARGIAEVCWTFDPLVRRNARFNLHKLGALPTAYLPDFYGAMTDGVNVGDASDRLYVTWRLDSARAEAAARGVPTEPSTEGARALVMRVGDRPEPTGPPAPESRRLLVALPLDVEALRATDPELAAPWRLAVREALVGALAAGYAITALTRDGYYLLERS